MRHAIMILCILAAATVAEAQNKVYTENDLWELAKNAGRVSISYKHSNIFKWSVHIDGCKGNDGISLIESGDDKDKVIDESLKKWNGIGCKTKEIK